MQDTRALPSTGFRPPFGLGRVTFLCVAKEKSPKERPPPLVRPPASGALGSPVCPTARADGPSLASAARSASCLAAWTKGLTSANNRGQHPNLKPRGQLTAPYLFVAKIGKVFTSELTPRPPYGNTRLSHLCNKHNLHGCIGEKIIVSTATNGIQPYRGMILYRRPDSEYLAAIQPYLPRK